MQASHFADSVIENIPNMIFVKDATNLRFVRFNRAGEELLGLARSDLIGKTDFDFFPEDEAQAFQAKDRSVLEGNKIVDIPEERISTKSQGVRILHTKKIPIYDESGKPRYLVGISEDITERKVLEQQQLDLIQAKMEKHAIEKSAERLNFLAEASQLLGSSLDFESTLANITKLAVPTIADWCSVRLLQPNGKLQQIAVSHKDPNKIKWAWKLQNEFQLDQDAKVGSANVLRTGKSELIESVSTDLIKSAAQNDEHFHLLEMVGFRSYICTAIRDRGVVFGTLTLVTTDESGRNFNEADLQLAEDLSRRAGVAIENAGLFKEAQNVSRLKDEFLANLSHELRTPMNVIAGNAEILESEALDLLPEDLQISVHAISRNAKAQTTIIGDLLDVSSIITGKVSFKPTTLSPAKMICETIHGLQPTADAKGVTIQFSSTGSPDHVLADPTRLNQIIWNLVSNAVKFTTHGGTVSVAAARTEQNWTITVRDSGKGIDPDFLPYVFDRFRQEDATTTRRYGGLGLGLSIVRHLAELHGGSVKAESGGPGQGATFTVSFPLNWKAKDSDLKGPSVSEEHNSGIAKGKIDLTNVAVLLVDDSSDNRSLIHRMLAKAGAKVVDAEGAVDAREKLETFVPDVIVSDIGMPEEDGLEFIKKLRASRDSQLKKIPAIALTAYARDEEKGAAFAAGFQIHVAKPVSASLLLKAVHEMRHQ
jgi:PAS domain S-box-containing protein